MSMAQLDRFVRIPTELLEALLHARLNGTQCRILLWVIRHTYGWHRRTVVFSWYQIAKALSLDRGGVVRAGNALLQAGILQARDGWLGIQTDRGQWDRGILPPSDDVSQLWISGIEAMTKIIATDDARHRKRCQESSLFRRAKDSSKDRKTVVVGARSVDNRNGERRIYEGTGPGPPWVEQLMDHYIALNGKALTSRQTAAFYRRFRKSATALLEAYGQNLQGAKEAVSKTVRRSKAGQ